MKKNYILYILIPVIVLLLGILLIQRTPKESLEYVAALTVDDCNGKSIGARCGGGILAETGKNGLIMAERDAGIFDWDTALKSCPQGWELPMGDELFNIYQNLRGSGADKDGYSSNNFCVASQGKCREDDPWFPYLYWSSQTRNEKYVHAINFRDGVPTDQLRGVNLSARCVKRTNVDSSRPNSLSINPSDSPRDWAAEYVEKLRQNKIIGAEEDFAGDQAIKRSEAVKILVLASKVDLRQSVLPFSDVSSENWYAVYLKTAYALKWISGYPDGTFRGENTLTRAESTKILMTAAGKRIDGVTTSPFPDVPSTHWSAPFISSAVNLGLVSGYGDGTFRPNDLITKNEFAKLAVVFFGL
ncbi:S-layer homology domain-containing protein [Candidatus Peregrinibacteria bacterium]|nr:S-layer homology domain-containing protein [Candidatus Peregrinibacteria bacterium]